LRVRNSHVRQVFSHAPDGGPRRRWRWRRPLPPQTTRNDQARLLQRPPPNLQCAGPTTSPPRRDPKGRSPERRSESRCGDASTSLARDATPGCPSSAADGPPSGLPRSAAPRSRRTHTQCVYRRGSYKSGFAEWVGSFQPKLPTLSAVCEFIFSACANGAQSAVVNLIKGSPVRWPGQRPGLDPRVGAECASRPPPVERPSTRAAQA
jgi:hypothetical protein